MSPDSAIRAAFEAEVLDVHAAPNALDRVSHRARRRRLVARGSVAVALAAMVAVGAYAASSDLFATDVRPAEPRLPTFTREGSAAVYAVLSGTYRTDITDSRRHIGTGGLNGSWTMKLGGRGRVEVTPPRDFEGAFYGNFIQSEYYGAGSTVEFVNLFTPHCQIRGRYTWVLQDDRLTLSSSDETCHLEGILLERTWDKVR